MLGEHSRIKKIIIIAFLIILFSTDTVAIKVKNPRLIETQWGTTDAHWSKFEYLKDKVESTPLYWYRDYDNLTVSEITCTEYFNQVNTTYSTEVTEADVWVTIERNIKEYKEIPFTEVTVKAKSSGYLASMQPNFPTLSKGEYVLFPGYTKPISAKDVKKGWNSLLKEEFKDIYPSDNWILIYDKNKTSTLFIMNKRLDGLTSHSNGEIWSWYFAKWKFEHISPKKVYTYKYWLTPIFIHKDDSTRLIGAKASDLAHEALVKPVKIYENKTRGYDYWLIEVWYRFETIKNEWHINPFKTSPHSRDGFEVSNACMAAIYLPENATAINGPEGYPVVFNSTGKNAIGLYFKDSINGARGSDKWFMNKSAGGGFYLKKFNPEGEVVRIYYRIPADPLIKEPVIESVNPEIPINSELNQIPSYSEERYIIKADYVEFSETGYLLPTISTFLLVIWMVFLIGIRRY